MGAAGKRVGQGQNIAASMYVLYTAVLGARNLKGVKSSVFGKQIGRKAVKAGRGIGGDFGLNSSVRILDPKHEASGCARMY